MKQSKVTQANISVNVDYNLCITFTFTAEKIRNTLLI